jgi:hypothetical protein
MCSEAQRPKADIIAEQLYPDIIAEHRHIDALAREFIEAAR